MGNQCCTTCTISNTSEMFSNGFIPPVIFSKCDKLDLIKGPPLSKAISDSEAHEILKDSISKIQLKEIGELFYKNLEKCSKLKQNIGPFRYFTAHKLSETIEVYYGSYFNGERSGMGYCINLIENSLFVGNYKNDKVNGKGCKLILPKNDSEKNDYQYFEGEFNESGPDGYCKCI